MLLTDHVALITGGAGLNGLGFATARLLASHGARVVITRPRSAPSPPRPPPRSAHGHLGLVANVTVKADVEAAVARVLETVRPHRHPGQQRRHHAAAQDGRHHRRRLRRACSTSACAARCCMSQAVHPGDAAPEAAARSSASRRSRRSAAAASSAARTTRRPRPACWAWRARWRANSAPTASASTASPPASSAPTSARAS